MSSFDIKCYDNWMALILPYCRWFSILVITLTNNRYSSQFQIHSFIHSINWIFSFFLFIIFLQLLQTISYLMPLLCRPMKPSATWYFLLDQWNHQLPDTSPYPTNETISYLTALLDWPLSVLIIGAVQVSYVRCQGSAFRPLFVQYLLHLICQYVIVNYSFVVKLNFKHGCPFKLYSRMEECLVA